VVTDIEEIKTHVEMSDNLGEFVNVLTMNCEGHIITLGPYPEIEPDRVLITVGYLSGPMVWGSEGTSPENAFANLKRQLAGPDE